MTKAHHAWNVFSEFYSESGRAIFFNLDGEPIVEEYTDHDVVTEKYKDVFAVSTDYETATDNMDHWFAEHAGDRWMRRCGIPKILRNIVRDTCFRERRILFKATGYLSTIGNDYDEDNSIRSIILKRGILMGDPLTKVILHICNICVRDISETLINRELANKLFIGITL